MRFIDRLKLFRMQLKQSRAFGVIFTVLRPASWAPRNYEAFSKEAYEQVAWVYACINAIATSVASVKWNLYEKTRDNKPVMINEHPLIRLINRPNKFMTRYEFFEAWAGYLAISGNSYWELAGLNQQQPTELYALRPDKIEIIPDSKNFIGGYKYIEGAQSVIYNTDEIIHYKFFSPTNYLYGLSPIQVAAKIVDTENAMVELNKKLIDNGLKPEGAFVTDGKLSEESFRRLKEQIRVEYFDTTQRGTPMLLESGLKWQQIGISGKDMEFLSLKKMNRVDICSVFDVPPEIIGDKEHATYSNYQEARKSFWEETIIPRYLDRLKEKMNNELVPRYGDRLVLDYDLSNIPAMRENYNQLVDSAYKLWQMGVPLNQINERLGLGFDTIPGGDTGYISSSVLPVGAGEEGLPEDQGTTL